MRGTKPRSKTTAETLRKTEPGRPDDSDMMRMCLRDLYARHHRFVWRICRRYVQNSVDADDLAHDVLLRAARGSSGFRGDSAETTWLYRVAVNQCRTAVKKEHRQQRERCDAARQFSGRHPEGRGAAGLHRVLSPAQVVTQGEDPGDVAARVLAALGNLEDHVQRRLAHLRFGAGLPQRTIARETGLPRTAVRRRLERLHERAFDLFRDYLREGPPLHEMPDAWGFPPAGW